MAFEPRLLANGQPCCSRTLADGRLAFPPNACAACRQHANARQRRTTSLSGAPPEAYAKDIAALRRAGSYPAPPALRAAGDYAPPKPYSAWIDAMHAETNGTAPTPAPPTPLDAHGIPDAYARDIAKLKEQTR